MKLKKLSRDNLINLEIGTRVLVTIDIPLDRRNEMYTGVISKIGIDYDDGKIDYMSTVLHYMDQEYMDIYVIGG